MIAFSNLSASLRYGLLTPINLPKIPVYLDLSECSETFKIRGKRIYIPAQGYQYTDDTIISCLGQELKTKLYNHNIYQIVDNKNDAIYNFSIYNIKNKKSNFWFGEFILNSLLYRLL